MSDSIIGKQNLEIEYLKGRLSFAESRVRELEEELLNEKFAHEETRKQMRLI